MFVNVRTLPLGVAFVVQTVVTFACLATVVSIFTIFHQRAVERAAHDAVSASLNYAREDIAEPFLQITPQIRAAAKRFQSVGPYCADDWSAEQHVDIMEQVLPLLSESPQLLYAYQQLRRETLRPGAPANSTENSDYNWGDCGCAPSFCFFPQPGQQAFAITNSAYPNASQNNEVVDVVPHPANQFPYTQRGMKMTSKDTEGVWGDGELYEDVFNNRLSFYKTFHVPIVFSPQGYAVRLVSADFGLGWMRDSLRNMHLPSTETIIIEASTMILASTTYDIPLINQRNASQPFIGSLWNSTETPSAELNDAVVRVLKNSPGGDIARLNETLVLQGGSDDIVGAQALREGTLHLVIITVTSRGYYYSEGERVRIVTITIGAVGLLLCALASLTVWRWISKPLQVMAADLYNCAHLQVNNDLAGTSSRIREVQVIAESAAIMAQNLQEYKKFLPYSMQVENESSTAGDTIRHKERPAPGIGSEEAEVAILFTDLLSSTALWQDCPEGMSDGLVKHNRLQREAIAEMNGYEVKTIGDSFMVSFDTLPEAVAYGLHIQQAMASAEWPPKLREYTDEGSWTGLRLRIGVCFGKVRCESNQLTARMDYLGSTVNKAARLEGAGPAGCVTVDKSHASSFSTEAIGFPLNGVELRGLGKTDCVALLPKAMQKRADDVKRAVNTKHPVRYTKLKHAVKSKVTLEGRDDALIEMGSHGSRRSSHVSSAHVIRENHRFMNGTGVKVLLVDSSILQSSLDLPRTVFSTLNMCLGRTEGAVTGVSGCTVSLGWGFVWASPTHQQNAFRFMSMLRKSASHHLRLRFGASTGPVQRQNVGDGVRFVSYAGQCVALCDELCPGLAGLLAAQCLFALPSGDVLPDDFRAARPLARCKFLGEVVTVQEIDLRLIEGDDLADDFSDDTRSWGWSAEYKKLFRERRQAEAAAYLDDEHVTRGIDDCTLHAALKVNLGGENLVLGTA